MYVLPNVLIFFIIEGFWSPHADSDASLISLLNFISLHEHFSLDFQKFESC